MTMKPVRFVLKDGTEKTFRIGCKAADKLWPQYTVERYEVDTRREDAPDVVGPGILVSEVGAKRFFHAVTPPNGEQFYTEVDGS